LQALENKHAFNGGSQRLTEMSGGKRLTKEESLDVLRKRRE